MKVKHLTSLILAGSVGINIFAASAQTTSPVGDLGGGASLLPTGQIITPTASPGSTFSPLATGLRSDSNADAAEPVATATSPDGNTLLVLTSGYNLNFKDEKTGANITYPLLDPVTGAPTANTTRLAERIFVYDVSTGTPVKKQQINVPNTYNGIVWEGSGQRFYVSGGIDDRIYAYRKELNGLFVPEAPFVLLGHNDEQTAPLPKYNGGLLKDTPAGQNELIKSFVTSGAVVAGLGLSKDGKTLVAANFQNDSVSIIDTATRKIFKEVKFLVPGQKKATGEYPFDVAVKSDRFSGAASVAYVSSQRDNEVVVVDLAGGSVTGRIPVGSQPNKMVLSPSQNLLYVANGNSDTVSIIDTTSNGVVRTISLARPNYKYKGGNPNFLTLSADGKTLYATLAGENAVAVINLKNDKVTGRIPTGWYPNAVNVSKDGKNLYVVNAKANSGPNPAASRTTAAGLATDTTFQNQYTWALEKGGLSVIPIPAQKQVLQALSRQVDRNNGFSNQKRKDQTMEFLKTKIKHVIYVVKENRTYDQVLGDLPVGNGDPQLALFPQPISPNHHKLAEDFVTLDNFYDSGESSGVGWNWSTYGRTTDFTEKTQSVLYGNSSFNGLTYDYEGQNRNISLALPETSANPSQITVRATGLVDPTGSSGILPGDKDANAPEGDGDLEPGVIGGYLWDSALRAGKTVRNYGFYTDSTYYNTATGTTDPTQPDPATPLYIPITPTPFASQIPQSPVAKKVLLDKTDIYFRGYDQKNSDIYLFSEWFREFQDYVTNDNLPNLSLVRLSHDHFGSFSNAAAGLNTPALQMADDDYALGRLLEEVSQSKYWADTAIVVVEDDSQNGPDHVDSHRSLAYIISPYTKRKALVSTNYNTTNLLRTIEDLLDIDYLGQFDANAKPMSDVFAMTPDFSAYSAVIPGSLCAAPVDPNLVPACQDPQAVKTAQVPALRDKTWWASATQGFDFRVEDKIDPEAFNRVLWAGIKGDKSSYPTLRSRKNLRKNREQFLAKWRTEQKETMKKSASQLSAR
jgi:YVTN family beta-propeller protein